MKLLSEATISDLVGELHRRGYSYQPKDTNKARIEDEPGHAFMLLIKCFLICLILLGFALMGYLAYVSYRIG